MFETFDTIWPITSLIRETGLLLLGNKVCIAHGAVNRGSGQHPCCSQPPQCECYAGVAIVKGKGAMPTVLVDVLLAVKGYLELRCNT